MTRRNYMNTTVAIIINVVVMLLLVLGLYQMQKRHISFTKRVFLGLVLGIVFGAILQLIYGNGSNVVQESNTWFGIIGTGYVRLLRMIVIPLIFVSIINAIISQDSKNLGKMASLIIAILLTTTAISAFVGATTASVFNLSSEGLVSGDAEIQAGERLESRLDDFQSKPIQQQLIEIIPMNPIYAMSGQESSSTLSTVLIAALLAIAVIGLKRKKPESAAFFVDLIQSLHDVVMRLVTLILRLTPYGVLALMTRMVSTSNFSEILRLFNFVFASYVALIIMFAIHLIILTFVKLNPLTYLKKIAPVLSFAFTSRSSAGTLPLNVETQIDDLGVSEGHANLSASLGTSIGQNGCAGIYPAMLAVMIAPTVGINPLEPGFLIKLIIITALASFGIAGVGGGATFAALTVLSALGLPVALVGLLIAIEPLIDMGRTALNVSGSVVSGLVSGRMMDKVDLSIYNGKEKKAESF